MADYIIDYPFINSTVTSVTASAAAATLLARDDNRGKFILQHSGSNAKSYVKFGTSPTTTSATIVLTDGQTWNEEDYKGTVTVIHSTSSSDTYLFVTDITK